MAKNDAIAKAIVADPYLKERKAPSEADQQLYLKEVSFSCPLCGASLRHRRQKKTNKLYEIAHIFLNSPTAEQYERLSALPRLGDNSESFENKIALCNDSYEKVEEIALTDYCKWLDLKYAISLPELSFRDAVGRYIRVYGKNNCDERHPLHYRATEKAEKACSALLKLFDAYAPLKETEAEAQHSEAELAAYKKAQSLQFIAKITKRDYVKNEKEIRNLSNQIEELSSGLERGLLDVDAEASEQAV